MSRNPPSTKVLVLGAGNFGSCLADHLADSEHSVHLWARNEDVVRELNETHKVRLLNGVVLHLVS
jgi:glycerol-3-phosphate dehydrogenase